MINEANITCPRSRAMAARLSYCWTENAGTWMSRDPVGYVDNRGNLYEYALSSPFQYVDPFGELAVSGTALILIFTGCVAACLGCVLYDWPRGSLPRVCRVVICIACVACLIGFCTAWGAPSITDCVGLADIFQG